MDRISCGTNDYKIGRVETPATTDWPDLEDTKQKASKDLSPRELLSFYNANYSPLFDHVKPQKAAYYQERIVAQPSPIANHKMLQQDVEVKQNVAAPNQVKIPPMPPNSRRRIAWKILHKSFPLASVRIDDILPEYKI